MIDCPLLGAQCLVTASDRPAARDRPRSLVPNPRSVRHPKRHPIPHSAKKIPSIIPHCPLSIILCFSPVHHSLHSARKGPITKTNFDKIRRMYVRDKIASSQKRNCLASYERDRAKNTSPEILLRKALWQMGFRGHRLHPKNVPGRPDVAFTTRKAAHEFSKYSKLDYSSPVTTLRQCK